MNADNLDRVIERRLGDDSEAGRIDYAAAIWLQIAKAHSAELGAREREALSVAERYWQGEASESERKQHLECVCELADTLDHDSRYGTIVRALAATLMTTTGLSLELAEYLAETCETLGYSEEKAIDLFRSHVPNFS